MDCYDNKSKLWIKCVVEALDRRAINLLFLNLGII